MRGLDFFGNMLPEGPALARLAALAGVRPVDTYGILAAFGRDCAGAVMLLPDGEQPGAEGRGGYTPMTSADLRMVISELNAAPLGAALERGFRPSLAGFQRTADTHLGQRVGGQADIRKVTAASLIEEAAAWGIRRRTASSIVTETLDQILAAIAETPGDEQVLAIIRTQTAAISRGENT
jgi:hypothetical protein